MMRNETDLLDFVGSLGAVLTTIAAVVFFGQRASDVGKGVLYSLGVVIVIVSLPGIAPRRWLGQLRGHPRASHEGWRSLLQVSLRNPVDPQVRDELQRAAA